MRRSQHAPSALSADTAGHHLPGSTRSTRLTARGRDAPMKYACPCCDYLTLDQRGGYDICPVCSWEDDGTDGRRPDVISGPNHQTLREARANFARYGACDERSVASVLAPEERRQFVRADPAFVERAEDQMPPGWLALSRVHAAPFETELAKELHPDHLLWGQELLAFARREGRDDFLFVPRSGQGPVYCVHLTWSEGADPSWPTTQQYADLDDFLARWPADADGG